MSVSVSDIRPCFIHSKDMLYTMSLRYEKESPFNTGAGGGTADYCFAMMFAMLTILLSYPIVIMAFPVKPFFARNMVYFVMYIWSRRNPTAQANIWGVPLQAVWLPFAYLALTVFMGNPYFDLIHGLVIGHLYYFLAHVFPQVSGKDILVTPGFLVDQFGIGEYQPDRTAAEPRAAAAGQAGGRPTGGGGGHNWGGGGQRLGR